MTAVVVGRHDYGEADRIVRLLSPTHGKVAALARRARRGGRRYDGALEVGNRVQATLRRGRGELWHLVQMKLLDGRLHVRSDLVNLALLAYACELSGELSHPDHAERLFGLLRMALVVLGAVTAPPRRPSGWAWSPRPELRGILGLTRCAVCGEGWTPQDLRLRYAPAPAASSTSVPCRRPGVRGLGAGRRGARRTPPPRPRGRAPARPPVGARRRDRHSLGRPLKSRGVLDPAAASADDNARMVGAGPCAPRPPPPSSAAASPAAGHRDQLGGCLADAYVSDALSCRGASRSSSPGASA